MFRIFSFVMIVAAALMLAPNAYAKKGSIITTVITTGMLIGTSTTTGTAVA